MKLRADLSVVGLAAAWTVLCCLPAGAQPPQVQISDTPNDWGTSLTVTWTHDLTPDSVLAYDVWRLEPGTGGAPHIPADLDSVLVSPALEQAGWKKITSVGAQDTAFVDANLDHGKAYTYAVVARTATGEIASGAAQPLKPRLQILSHDRINILVAVALFIAVLLGLVERARRGAKLFVRKIAGLEAVEEAVGRSTEMGRPILYVPGLDPMDEVATVAAIDILGQVAKKAGEYETRLVVPNRDPIVMAVAQQVVRESYSAVGKPHLYREEDIFYVTYSQFGFAAAVAGLMLRERPATNFFIGHFYAESLVLAETGNATGAIQIAGTDSDAQLPFFITSCDYTLIGEELYAGSVYLSRQPLLLGALKSQDYAKLLLMVAMAIGIVLSAVNPELATAFRALFK
jgi:hypothetical protein